MPMKRLDCKPEVWGYGGRRGVIVGACLVAGVAAAVFAFGEVSHLVSSRRRLGTGSASRPTKGMCRSTGSAQGMDSHSGPVLGAGGSSGSAQGLSRPSDRVHGATSSAVGSALEGCVGSDQIVIVLGYRNPGERVNGINRFRVRAALRTLDPEARSAVIIFCGGAVASAVPEAELLADYAREELGYTGRTLLETSSESTWENIANAIELIDAELRSETSISIVSNSHHAEKARDHLWQMRPDLGCRLVRGGDYRFGELPLVKPIAAARGLLALRAMDRAQAIAPATQAVTRDTSAR
jgi:hypothetical protein